MSARTIALSIIIPMAQDETKPEKLLQDLENIPQHIQSEIILSAEGTRAKSLNQGAAKAHHEILFFLHADSRISVGSLQALVNSLQNEPDALHYFDLAFDVSGLMSLNAWGANIRSRLFGLPFGDQGFCISKAQFEKSDGYPEDVDYGEDVLFVRRARQQGIKLNRIPSKLVTSARQYQARGWLKLTLLRQWQLFNLLRHRV